MGHVCSNVFVQGGRSWQNTAQSQSPIHVTNLLRMWEVTQKDARRALAFVRMWSRDGSGCQRRQEHTCARSTTPGREASNVGNGVEAPAFTHGVLHEEGEMQEGDTVPISGNTTPQTGNRMLGRYRLLRRIGKGGMGEVWLGEDPRLHRQIAIKTLPLHNSSDREFVQRFEREARAAAALNHPHILPVHDYGEQGLPDGQAITYIVMPYVSGGTLAERIKKLAGNGTPMPADEAIEYLSQTADAIDYAHEQHVLHRDNKPSNMLMRSDNWILLADFGMARVLSDGENLTQAGVGIGTPEYMAPEQAQGKREAASDNYSLAVIAYQLFTGQLPFQADTPYAMTVHHIITPPPPPRQINPNLSPAVEQALLHGLAKEPAQRPPSARAFVEELRSALRNAPFVAAVDQPTLPASGTGAASTPITPPLVSGGPGDGTVAVPPASTGITRRRVLIGGTALLIGGGVGAWALASHLHPSSPTIVATTKPMPTVNPK